jgi:hypothetical protein
MCQNIRGFFFNFTDLLMMYIHGFVYIYADISMNDLARLQPVIM